MQCSYCGKNIEFNNEVTFENLSFCNNLCKHLWQSNGTLSENVSSVKASAVKTSSVSGNSAEEKKPEGIFLENLDFQIDLQGMGNKNLLIRASYIFGPRLFLDGKKLKPVKKQRLKRLRTYIVHDERGNPVEIKLKLRPFDAIPRLFINGKEHEIAPKYKWYDYLMIALPAFIAYIGGIPGVLTGGAALFTNSVLLRKINRKVLRYAIVNINTVFATIAFLKLVVFIAPYWADFEFRTFNSYQDTAAYPQMAPVSKHVWETYKLTTMQNVGVTSRAGAMIGSRRYFFSGGRYVFTADDGSYVEGRWKPGDDNKSISINSTTGDGKVEIISLNESEFVLRFNGLNFYHRAI